MKKGVKSCTNHEKHKAIAKVHTQAEGKNRHTRRAKVAIDRGALQREKEEIAKFEAFKASKLRQKKVADRIAAKQREKLLEAKKAKAGEGIAQVHTEKRRRKIA